MAFIGAGGSMSFLPLKTMLCTAGGSIFSGKARIVCLSATRADKGRGVPSLFMVLPRHGQQILW